MRNNQNKRMRGRNNRGHNNNNRGNHHNPLTRVYESNGPEVKIRGTAHHVAEKYLQLARDASSSGDPVTAENHYQHAEHYLRLIAAAQEQFRQQNPYYQAPPAPGENVNDGPFEDGDEDGQQQPQHGQQGQPNFGNQQPQQNQQPYPPREHQQQNYGQQQPHQHRPQQQPHQNQPQPNYPPQYQQPQPQPNFDGNNGLPSFITGGQPQQNAQGDAMNGRDNNSHDNNGQQNGDRFPRRRRRHPRGPRPDMAGAPQGDQPPGE
jgi:hypothetical protein